MSFEPPPTPPQQPWWSQGAPTPQPRIQPPVPPQPAWARKRVALPIAAGLLFVGVGIGAGGGDDTKSKASAHPTATVTAKAADLRVANKPAPKVTVTVTATKTVTAKPKKKPAPKGATIPGEGTFVVGSDIKAGTYKTAGAEESVIPNCYWARLKGTSGTFKDIITNSNSDGPTTVTISSSDGAFKTSGCKTWKKVD
jgi:hypothetical protein